MSGLTEAKTTILFDIWMDYERNGNTQKESTPKVEKECQGGLKLCLRNKKTISLEI